MQPNPNGQWIPKPSVEALDRRYDRFAVVTHLVVPGEPIRRTLAPYLEGHVGRGDVVAVSEKIVAIAEGRAIPLRTIHPGPLARCLARQVSQLGHGLGLRRPETMEMAIREAGAARILAAAAVGAVGRLLGRRGDFYRVAGRAVAAIDGPGPDTIPPYDRYVVLAPTDAAGFAAWLGRRLSTGVAVVDVNDVGSEVLGVSPGVDAALVKELMRDNPMGQGRQRTPIMVLTPSAAPPRTHALAAQSGA